METTTNTVPIQQALGWCLGDGNGSEAARVLAQILLNKYNPHRYPSCDLQEVASVLNDTQRDWVIGIILYAGATPLTPAEAGALQRLTFNEWQA